MYSPLRALIAEHIKSLKYKKRKDQIANPIGINFHINLVATDLTTATKITEATDESYEMVISYAEARALLSANISAVNYFGLRHGLETLFQLVEYDNVAGSFIVLNDVRIKDWPEFPHRGVMLDTGRNFVQLDTIQATLRSFYSLLAEIPGPGFDWDILQSPERP